MSHDRDALITAYRMYTNCTHAEADRVVRGVELAYAEKQNTELQLALDEADGQHLKETQELRQANAALQRMLEAVPNKHMRFGTMNPDGTFEEPTQCADWCYACKLETLREEVSQLKKELGIT